MDSVQVRQNKLILSQPQEIWHSQNVLNACNIDLYIGSTMGQNGYICEEMYSQLDIPIPCIWAQVGL